MPKPYLSLPSGYRLQRTIDLSKQFRLLVGLNLVGIGLFILGGWLFFAAGRAVHPEFRLDWTSDGGLEAPLGMLLAVLVAFTGTLLVHEGVHGFFFWWFTRTLPHFGLRSAYAYAAAPDWFIPRNPYLVIGSAPLLVITALGIIILPVLPPGAWLLWWFSLTLNLSGAVGDIYIVGWLSAQPTETLVRDFGDRMEVYMLDAIDSQA